MQEINPYATPKSEVVDRRGTGNVFRHKKQLVMAKDALLPQRCFYCNQYADIYKKTKLSFMNPWWYLLFLINILVLFIVALIVTKRFTIELPICNLHNESYQRRKVIAWILFISGILSFFATAAASNELTQILSLLGGTLVLTSIFFFFAARKVYVAKIKDDKLWIAGCKRPFLDSLPDYGQ